VRTKICHCSCCSGHGVVTGASEAMLDVGCSAAGLWVKRHRPNLNRPRHRHGGGNDGGDDGVSADNRDRGRLRRGRSRARAHSLDS